MCKESVFYSGSTAWTYWDNSVSSNSLCVDFFTYQTAEQSRLQTPKIKFVIYSQSSTSSSVTMFNSELYRYTYNLKKIITDKLNEHISHIKTNKNYTDGFTQVTNRNNLYTTIMYNELLDAPCIRVMIGEKEQSVLDSDKVYIPIPEYISLHLTLNKLFDNYCLMSQKVSILDYIKKVEEKYDKGLLDLNDRIDRLSDSIRDIGISPRQTAVQSVPESNSEDNITLPVLDEISLDDSESNVESEQEDTENKAFDSFLTDKYDSIELDLPKETEKNEEKTQKEIVQENFFQKKILKDNFKNLELIILNCVNSRIPLDAFVNTIYSETGIDMYKGISNIDRYSINYILSQDIKYNINNYINNKKNLSNGINPIILDNTDKTNIQDRIDCAYFLLLASIYLNKIKTDLNSISDEKINKNLFTYCFKTITSPFVLTYTLDISRDILIESVIRLYNKLRAEKFFDEFESEIYNNTKIKVDLNVQHIKDSINRVYDTALKFKDKLIVETSFNSKYMLLTYNDIKLITTDYKPDIINRLLIIEGYYWNKNIEKCYKEVLKSTDGLPKEILSKFGIGKSKYNNEILVRYIKEKYPDFSDLEQIKNINVNIYDILDNIDITNYPLDILKALYFWNVDSLPKNITYEIFKKNIEDSHLQQSELLSLIYDNKYKLDNTFYNALLI